jgi:hypothetical protein
MANVPDRSQENRIIQTPQTKMVAKCGHEDPLGYMSGTVCGKCARKNHKKAMGR